LEKVLVEILTKVCNDKNSQNWSGFEVQCDKYLKENKNFIPIWRFRIRKSEVLYGKLKKDYVTHRSQRKSLRKII